MVYIDGAPIVGGIFPNNEKYYNRIDNSYDYSYDFIITKENREVVLTVVFENNGDLFDALVYKKYLDDKGYKKVTLVINFMPYGQMDREMPDKMFTFKYFAQLINDANFYEVYFCDPHSTVMAATINRARIFNGAVYHNYDLYFYPDVSAYKKYSEIYPDIPCRYGNKKRNLDTGEIIKYEVIADPNDIKDKRILIRDDLCMGGRTFKEAATALHALGAKQVDLYITHLMPQAKDFYEHKDEYGITNFYSDNTLDFDWYEGP